MPHPINTTASSGDDNNFVLQRNKLSESFVRGEMDEEFYTNRFICILNEEALPCYLEVLEEECRRVHVPMGSTCRNIAAAAADAARRRIEEEESAHLRYSRRCGICLTDFPCQRSVFIECGHTTCRACAEQIGRDVYSHAPNATRPFCRKASKITPLIEDLGKDYDQFIVNICDDLRGVVMEKLREEDLAGYRDLLILKVVDREIGIKSYNKKYNSCLQKEASLRGIDVNVVKEEDAQRYSDELPKCPREISFPETVAFAVCIRKINCHITQLRRENEECSKTDVQYRRSCISCPSKNPRLRSVFIECGHVICRSCADKMTKAGTNHCCRICREASNIVHLYENVIEL